MATRIGFNIDTLSISLVTIAVSFSSFAWAQGTGSFCSGRFAEINYKTAWSLEEFENSYPAVEGFGLTLSSDGALIGSNRVQEVNPLHLHRVALFSGHSNDSGEIIEGRLVSGPYFSEKLRHYAEIEKTGSTPEPYRVAKADGTYVNVPAESVKSIRLGIHTEDYLKRFGNWPVVQLALGIVPKNENLFNSMIGRRAVFLVPGIEANPYVGTILQVPNLDREAERVEYLIREESGFIRPIKGPIKEMRIEPNQAGT